MFAQQCIGKQNLSLAIQKSIDNNSLRSRPPDPDEVPSNIKMSKLPKPISMDNSKSLGSSDTLQAMKAPSFSGRRCVSSFGNKNARKTGIPVLTCLRSNNTKPAAYVRTLDEVPLDEDDTMETDEMETVPNPEPVINITTKACKEFISDVEQILSHTLLKGVAFGSMLEASKKKHLLEDELSDIMEDRSHSRQIVTELPKTPESSNAPLKIEKQSSERRDVDQPTKTWGMVHRRNSKEVSSRQSSRSRSYRKSRSRRSRRHYVIPENAGFKCSPTVICAQPKAIPDLLSIPKPALNPLLDFASLNGNFNFGTEELEKMNNLFIQSSDRLCSRLCNFLQDLCPSLQRQYEYDVSRDEITYPKYNVIKTRNPLSCFFADCENLKFCINQNHIPGSFDKRPASILVECKECPASDCSFHTASIYICNGTMEMGTCEHLSCSKSNPVILLKNILMKETMVIRTKSLITGWMDADFMVYKLDEESNDPFDETMDGPLIGLINRRLPKIITPATFDRPTVYFPELERLNVTYHDKLNSFSKGIILGATLLLKHDILS